MCLDITVGISKLVVPFYKWELLGVFLFVILSYYMIELRFQVVGGVPCYPREFGVIGENIIHFVKIGFFIQDDVDRGLVSFPDDYLVVVL